MAYIGSKPNDTRQLARREFSYAVTVASTTTFTGSDAGGKTLSYQPGELEVYMNGVRLDPADYTATTGSSVVLGSGANIGDNINIFAGQILPTDDYVSKAAGGTMTGNLTVQGTVAATTVTGDGSGLTGTGSPSIDDNGNATALTIDSDETIIVNRSAAISNAFSINVVGKSSGGIIMQPAADTNFEAMRVVNHGLTAAIGSVRVVGGDDLAIAGGATGIRFDSDEAKIYPTDGNGDVSNGALNIGDPSFRFKDAYLSGGVYLGGTGSANKLDDYEEGTWTPSVNAGFTISTIDHARYTKVGGMVHVQTIFGLSGTGNTTHLEVGGLPFITPTTGYSTSSVDFGKGGIKGTYVRTESATTTVKFYYPSESITVNRLQIRGNQIGAGYILFGLTYQTNS
jgi:hypothetical protein